MSVVLRCWLSANARDAGEQSIGYLVDCDFEAAEIPGIYPTGIPTFSEDISQARRFNTPSDAFDFWRTRSQTCPNRPDGRQNRPLTMFSIEIIPFKESKRD